VIEVMDDETCPSCPASLYCVASSAFLTLRCIRCEEVLQVGVFIHAPPRFLRSTRNPSINILPGNIADAVVHCTVPGRGTDRFQDIYEPVYGESRCQKCRRKFKERNQRKGWAR
jgi:hypothetical protein